jgi:hypothetical protein
MNAPAYTLTHESVTIVWEGKPYTVQKGSPQFQSLRIAILNEKWADVPKHLTVGKSLSEWAKGKFAVSGETIFFEKNALPRDINNRILKMAASGEDPTCVFNFWERLQKNPSYRSVEQLWPFLQHQGIPLTPDGCFLAYKGVRDNYKDQHSNTVDNKPGVINEMPRNKISDDPQVPCHEGYHVGDLSYAKSFASRVIVCKVDPADVVCVPYDESHRKMRVCKYEVIGNHNGSYLPDTVSAEEDTESYDDKHERLSRGKVSDLMAKEADEGLKPVEPKRKSAKGFTAYDKMGMEGLMECSISELRLYATHGLEILGASKIPGGKVSLISRILAVRA